MPQHDADQRALLDLVRDVASNELATRAEAYERSGEFPAELFGTLAKLDLLGLPFAVDDGGGGQPSRLYLQVIEEFSRAFATVGLGVSVHTLATGMIAAHAKNEVRAQVLPRLVGGTSLAAYSLSEPGSGSDAAALSTTAERVDDHYVLNGTKAWVTHAGHADLYVVMCRTGPDRTRGISALLVPAGTPGLSFAPPERKMGMRSSPTGQLVLSDAQVPADHLLANEGDGFAMALAALDGGRLGIAACAVGLAQAALDRSVAYAQEREQFGRTIGEFQGVGFMLADMAAGIEAARALYLRAADARDAGEPFGTKAAMAKLIATDTAMAVTTDAVQVHGGYGYTTEFSVERYMREAKVLQIVEGTNQIQRLVIARDLLAPARAVRGSGPRGGSPNV